MPETSSPIAPSTSCRTTPQSSFPTKLRPLLHRPRTGAVPRESVPSVYLAAGCDVFADGRNSSGRYGWLYPTTGLRIAGSRLSDHSSTHILSGSQPDRDGHHSHGAPGAPIRRTTGFEPDDLHEFRWHFRHRPAVQPLSEH